MGRIKLYEPWEKRPLHPVTGVPADYMWEYTKTGICKPRWNKTHMREGDPDGNFFPTRKVALLLGVSVRAVQNLIKHGFLKSTTLNSSRGRKRHFVRGSDIVQFVKSQSKIAPMPRKAGAR